VWSHHRRHWSIDREGDAASLASPDTGLVICREGSRVAIGFGDGVRLVSLCGRASVAGFAVILFFLP
jgi:hypothetical protein